MKCCVKLLDDPSMETTWNKHFNKWISIKLKKKKGRRSIFHQTLEFSFVVSNVITLQRSEKTKAWCNFHLATRLIINLEGFVLREFRKIVGMYRRCPFRLHVTHSLGALLVTVSENLAEGRMLWLFGTVIHG